MGPPKLWRARLEQADERDKESRTSEDEYEVQASVGVSRLKIDEIGLELEVQVRKFFGADLDVAYRTNLMLIAPESIEDIEQALKVLVSRPGLGALYPYVREALSDMTRRAGLPPLTIPFVILTELLPPDQVELPAYGTSTMQSAPEAVDG